MGVIGMVMQRNEGYGAALSHLLLSLSIGLAFGLFVMIFGSAIYRRFFHPLRKFPGPFLASWTDAYMAYFAWRGDRYMQLYKLHQKYGPVVRTGPNHLSFSSASALKTIYGYKSNVRKGKFYTAFPANKHAFNVHSAIDKQDHARKRRVMSHAFSDAAIKAMERYILSNVRTGCYVLADTITGGAKITDGQLVTEKKNNSWGTPVNVAEWCNYLTFDIMGDLAFGKSFDMLESPKNRFAADLVTMAAHRHLICGTHLALHRSHLDHLLFPNIAAGRARYLAYSKAELAERQALGSDSDRKDFFHYLLQARDPQTGQGFNTNELWGESNLLIIAGSDTTSSAMAATLHYLLHNPSKLEKAVTEVRRAFSNLEDIVSGSTLTSCTYLRACIDEGMRLAPPVPGYLPREVLAGGLDIDGYHVPEGTDVGVPHYVLHHNPAYFPKPYEYIPERWLVGEKLEGKNSSPSAHVIDEDDVHAAKSAFAPFSIGPRGCIGKGMAYHELTITLARLLWAFDLRLSAEKLPQRGLLVGRKPVVPEEYIQVDTFTSWKDGPLMEVRKRAEVSM